VRRERESIQNDLDTIQTKKKEEEEKEKNTHRDIYDRRHEKKDAEHREEKI